MDYEKTYVFEPENSRPAKKRKLEPRGLQASWKIRREAYQKAWQGQQSRIDENLRSLHASTIAELSTFLEDQVSSSKGGRIPTGIISTGPDAASQVAVFDQLSRAQHTNNRRIFVSLSASDGANLKAVVKAIIQKATARNAALSEDDEDLTTTKKGSKLLNYDLQILHDHVRERQVQQVVLAIHDTEAFDSDLLSELIDLLGYWSDRIPFVFLFSIATSLDFLQQRLSREAVKSLKGQLFDVAPSEDEIERVFDAVTSPKTPLWIGPGLMSMVLERQSDYIQNIDSFVESIRYAYMSCYYANALSIFLDAGIEFRNVPSDHYEAIRNLPSFRVFARKLLDHGEANQLRHLLDSDEDLFRLVKQEVKNGKQVLADITTAASVVRTIQTHLPNQQISSKSKLYSQAMSNKLNDSGVLRSLLLSIRKAPSHIALEVIDAIILLDITQYLREQLIETGDKLAELVRNQGTSSQPLRSEDDIKNNTLRTTVVAQKVELSKQKLSLSKQDAAYTAVLRRFTNLLEQYFKDTLIDPKEIVINEVFLYDLKSPHREVFTPRPRHAVERALAAPHDYLACNCCTPSKDGDEATLSASQPATAVLYQLYLESGGLINVADLWQAFQAVMGDERSEEQNMALFQRAAAELRYLGFVKNTRKRVDHVAKVAWRGL